MGMRFKQRAHITDLLFTLSLFCIFVVSALVVVMIGANVYRNTVNQMDRNYEVRASITYLSTKVRQNDGAGAVTLTDIEGTPVLCLTSEIEGEAYNTWIYHQDGALWEYFADALSPVDLATGQRIVNIDTFLMEQEENGSLRFTSRDSAGRSVDLVVSPRCAVSE
jgi:hypothetical protein